MSMPQATSDLLSGLAPDSTSAQPSLSQPDIEFVADLNLCGIRSRSAITGFDDNRVATFEDSKR
jgi:hypothetical protein